MPHFTRAQRCRWSLPLVVVLLLPWTFGICGAMAEVLCFEPDGKVILVASGQPCDTTQLEQGTGKPCFDLKVDTPAEHSSVPPSPFQFADLQLALFIPALAYVLVAPQDVSVALPAATGPPVSTHVTVLRKITVLLI